jgi:hypothetical protein
MPNRAAGVVAVEVFFPGRCLAELSQLWPSEDNDHQLERGWLRFPPGFMTFAP